ncbi:hypothetical protein RRG08_004012 [Elysia crispata]|uniref:Uncharacterized protein n=1 Tax=Elysia crispata TaxID=231223 RepID=A0AAE1CTI3_9GAST|nr:hypothetical protein RRG08_004012 [Elysia crispata]
MVFGLTPIDQRLVYSRPVNVSGEETTSLADVAVTSIARLSSGFGVRADVAVTSISRLSSGFGVRALGEISQQREREGESSLPGLVLYSSVSGEETTSLADVAVTSIARLSSGFGVRADVAVTSIASVSGEETTSLADVAVTSIARLSSGFGVRADVAVTSIARLSSGFGVRADVAVTSIASFPLSISGDRLARLSEFWPRKRTRLNPAFCLVWALMTAGQAASPSLRTTASGLDWGISRQTELDACETRGYWCRLSWKQRFIRPGRMDCGVTKFNKKVRQIAKIGQGHYRNSISKHTRQAGSCDTSIGVSTYGPNSVQRSRV